MNIANPGEVCLLRVQEDIYVEILSLNRSLSTFFLEVTMCEPKTIMGWLVIFPRRKDSKMPCQNMSQTDIEYLKRFLPENHETHVCKLQVKSERSFTATLRTRMTTEAEARKWLDDFEKKTFTTWRVNQTFPKKEKARNTFKICLHCHHNTKGRGIKNKYKSKNTSCKAILMICVKRVEQFTTNKKSRSKDVHFLEFPTRIVLRNDHNHSCEDSLPFRDVSKLTKDKLTSLIERGHNPYSMRDRLLFDLKAEYGPEFDAASKDRALCPDIHYCYRLYYDIVKKKKDGIFSNANLDKIIVEYNQSCGSLSAACSIVDNTTVISICTPVMKRVNAQMRYSGELVFIDSTSDFEQFGCKMYLLLTHSNSVAGGLPVGVIIITKSESKAALASGLQMLTTILGEDGFYRRGLEGPQVFLTDDYEPLRSAICETFPNSYSILCTFRFLQANWKWLWNVQNEIEVQDRHHLLQIVKEIMYAPSVNAVIETYQNYALLNPTVNRYPHFLEYLRTQVQRQHLWALAFRQHLLVRGYTTNSLSEAAFHLISQHCLKRTKMFHYHQMFDFIIIQLEKHFQSHLLEVAESTFLQGPIPKFLMKKIHLVPREKIKQVSDTEFVIQGVEHRSNFTVDTDLEMCSCAFASKHNSCKHLFSVFHHFNIYSLAHLANTEITSETKQLLYRISTGLEAPEPPKPHPPSGLNEGTTTATTNGNSNKSSEGVSTSTGEPNIWDVELTTFVEDTVSSTEEEGPPEDDSPDNPGNSCTPDQESEKVKKQQLKPVISYKLQKRIRPVTAKLRKLMEDLNRRMRQDPDVMIPSIEHFIGIMESFTTNERIAQALSSFKKDPVENIICLVEVAPQPNTVDKVSYSVSSKEQFKPTDESFSENNESFSSTNAPYENPTYGSSARVSSEPYRNTPEVCFESAPQESYRISEVSYTVPSEPFRANGEQVSFVQANKKRRLEEQGYHRDTMNIVQPLIVTIPSVPAVTVQPVQVPENSFALEHAYSLSL